VNAYGVAHNMEAMRAAGAKPRRAVAVGDRVKTALALVVIHPLRYPLSLHHSDEGIVLGSERGML
jgi:hypothetical protein